MVRWHEKSGTHLVPLRVRRLAVKIQKLLILLLLLCMAGCAVQQPQESSLPETIPAVTVEPTNATTAPPETIQEETEPTQSIQQPEPDDGDFVKVAAYIPDIVVDLRYATEENFTNQRIYDFTDLWLCYGTVKKLMLVQEELRQYGYSLKIWDGFRPVAAQFRLWAVCPDPTYVANPNKGFSSHSRGNTVDITLVNADGTEALMPTGFDDFSKLADRDYSDCSREAADNALFLEQLMIRYGFEAYAGEWWHFSDTQTYPVEEVFEPVAPALYRADCSAYISLRVKPDTAAQTITRIPKDAQFTVVATSGGFAAVEYQGLFGYVMRDYIQRID